MKFTTINNINELDNFFSFQSHSQFLQSWGWGGFLKSSGQKVIRLGIEDGNKLVAVMTLIKKSLPFNKSYFYCPRGPLVLLDIRSKKFEVMGMMFDMIKDIATKENILFLRFEPIFDITNIKTQICKTIDVQPGKTTMIDLRSSKNEILDNMHKKTRYNIRLAKKKGVKIIQAGAKVKGGEFEEFWKLMQATVKRDQFRLHDKKYYYAMLNQNENNRPFYAPPAPSRSGNDNLAKRIKNADKTVLSENALNLKIRLYKAEFKGKVIAANIVAFFGDTATYLHGASANEYRNAMAPYLLQWQTIKDAMDKGYHYYDFNGINETKWPGVTRFKLGYGGQVFEYPGTYDMVFNKAWYRIYKIVRKIRRLVCRNIKSGKTNIKTQN